MKKVVWLAVALVGLMALAGLAQAEDLTLNGAGASFPYPIYSQWAHKYNSLTGVKINYQSIGSGGGIAQIKAKTVDFGASDEPLKAEDLDRGRLGAVSHGHGRRGAGGECPGSGSRVSSSSPARCWRISSWAKSASGMTRPSRASIPT